MDKLLQDVRHGIRILRKAPVFSAVIILIVAVGVGAASTIFSIVESSLLWNENPNVDRWVMMRAYFPQQNMRVYSFSAAEYFDFRRLPDVFERVGAAHGINATLFVSDAPQLIEETFLTADMIPMTATKPLLGRVFTAGDDRPGAPLTTVLTYELWQHEFRGDPSILGRNIRIDDEHYTVIGVMPPHYEVWGGQLYLPFQLNPADSDRGNRRLRVVALIRKGISVEQANARLAQFAATLAHDHAGTNPEYQGMQVTTWNIKEAVIGGVKPVLLILMAVVGLIVLISCANIGNLLLARASGRRREMAVRAALGAPGRRIVRQLLTESLLLSLAGGALGTLLAAWGVPAAVALVGQSQLPNSGYARLDAGALLLALGVATAMGILFGLAPAAYSARGDLARAIREGGLQAGANREERWTRAALVVSQIALAMVVLAGAGLMIRTYRELLRLDIGYNIHNALTAQLTLPADRYPTGEKITAFYTALIERLDTTHGIEGAAVATGRPLRDRVTDVSTQDFSPAGHEGEKNNPNANFRVVTPQYFDVMGVQLLRGRMFSPMDTAQTDAVAIINQTMAKLYWPKGDAVGQSIRLGTMYSNGAGAAPEASAGDARAGRWVKIVGVVADAKQMDIIDAPVRQEIDFPLQQRPELARAVTLIVRSPNPTEQVTGAVRSAVAGIDPDRPIFAVMTLERVVADLFATKRLATVLLGFFAAVAMTLASVGLYAIMAYSVSQRTRDIGIRMALGARPADVLRLALGEAWKLTAMGLVVGIASALLATRMMRSLVYEVSTTDPLTFAVAAVVLAAVAFLASYGPARRATRIDPTIALRYE